MIQWPHFLTLVLGVTVAHWLGAEPVAGAPIEVGPRKQLFLDDFLVSSMSGVTRRIHPAVKHQDNPLIRQTEPWEEAFNIVYGSVIRDGDRFKAWYQSGPGVSYAESGDGIDWEKPRLDLVTVNGAKTNMLFRSKDENHGPAALPYYHELFGVYKDAREPDSARRYKMGFLSIDWEYKGPREGRFRQGQRRGLGVAGSPDGIHWQLIDSFATEAICDGATHWMVDPERGKVVLFGRTLKTPPEIEAAWSGHGWFRQWYSGRAVGRIESPDFVTWNVTAPMAAPVIMTADLQDTPGTEIYSMMVFPYESLFIGLVQVFLALPETPEVHVQLAVSHDGRHFTRVGDRSPFIANGPVGSWDRFNQSLANNPPLVVGDEIRFYYGGRTYRHAPYDGKDTGPRAGCIGLAIIPRDRFVSLEASFDGGEIITKPLRLANDRLHLNAKSDFGEIIIEALDPARRPIARSKPIHRDSLDTKVEWEGVGPQGVIVLRILLKNACLYALWCEGENRNPQ